MRILGPALSRMSLVLFFAVLVGPWTSVTWSAGTNVLFIAIDDLNDWVGFLGGHPQIKTPNMDRLAQRGVAFTNAHCAAPLCCPSRAAVFSGQQPFTTGIFITAPISASCTRTKCSCLSILPPMVIARLIVETTAFARIAGD